MNNKNFFLFYFATFLYIYRVKCQLFIMQSVPKGEGIDFFFLVFFLLNVSIPI